MIAKKSNAFDVLALFITFLFFLVGVLVSLNRYWQFDVWYYDFGIFNQAIWNASRFKLPIIDHFIVPGKIIFADHFNPSIFLLTPLYWFTDRAEILLVAQALFVAISGFIIYLIGIKLLKDKASSLFVMIAYYLFVGLQNAVITEFHELPLVTPFLALLYYSFITKNKKLFIFCFLIILGFKESLFSLGIGIGIFVFFTRREWRNIAIFVILFSILWAFFTIKIIIPFFSGQAYYYSPQFSLKTLFTDSGLKLNTLFYSFGTFLFLPVGAIWLYPLYLLHFAARFISDGSTRWGLGLHYSSEIAPSLVFGALLSIKELSRHLSSKYIKIICLLTFLISLFIFRFILHGPFLLAINPVFYQHSKDFMYLEKLIKKIPNNTSVAAQNNLALRFYKQPSYILTDSYEKNNPKFIFMDMRPGQNPNNFLGIKDSVALLTRIQSDNKYEIYLHEGDQYIFKRK